MTTHRIVWMWLGLICSASTPLQAGIAFSLDNEATVADRSEDRGSDTSLRSQLPASVATAVGDQLVTELPLSDASMQAVPSYGDDWTGTGIDAVDFVMLTTSEPNELAQAAGPGRLHVRPSSNGGTLAEAADYVGTTFVRDMTWPMSEANGDDVSGLALGGGGVSNSANGAESSAMGDEGNIDAELNADGVVPEPSSAPIWCSLIALGLAGGYFQHRSRK